MLKTRDVVNQCYILQERLGEDAFCERWRATALFSATKFLLRFFKGRPGIEALLSGYKDQALESYRVSNPAIHDFLEIERAEGRYFIASEFGGERPLSSLAGEEARFPLDHILRFGIELAQGLQAFHDHGLVYRCLDGQSILLRSRSGRPESIRIQKPSYAPFIGLLDPESAQDLALLGSIAPEAREGEGEARSDVYSLGVQLVRFITGRLPYPPSANLRAGASASLRYVANAFRRRGVPEALIAQTLKALRRNPRQRQASCAELAAGLRDFAEERRREAAREGRGDPFAELEALNSLGSGVAATEAAQTFDTTAYFRALAEAPEEPPPPQQVLLFPPRMLSSLPGMERIELEELAEQADEDERSVSDYLELAAAAAPLVLAGPEPAQAASAEPYAAYDYEAPAPRPAPAPKPAALRPPRPSGLAVAAPEPPAPESGLRRLDESAPSADLAARLSPEPAIGEKASGKDAEEEAARPSPPPSFTIREAKAEPSPAPRVESRDGGRRRRASPAPSIRAKSPAEAKPPQEPRGSPGSEQGRAAAPAVILELAADRARGRRKRNQASVLSLGIEWKREVAPSAIVIEGMEAAFGRSFRGRGSFRFIEEPRSGPAALLVAKALARFSAQGLVADLGRLRPGADATDFLRAFRESLAAALAAEPRASIRILAQRNAAADELGALRAPPLGELLFGLRGEEPDPDLVEGAAAAPGLARALASFGRRRRPFVLVLRGAEEIGPSVHAILIELARIAAGQPFCGFVFYGRETPPSWHVLAGSSARS